MLTQPAYWKPKYPAYISLAGWEFEKQRTAEVVRLKVKFAKLDRMINKADLMRKAAFNVHDTKLLCKYAAITIRLYEASNRIAEALIFDYKETLTF